MGWRDTIPGAEGLAEVASSVADVTGAATGKLNELLDEYGKAIAILEKYGFKVGQFEVTMGIPPEAQTSIEGSLEALPEEDLKTLLASHKEDKIISLILNTLLLAKQVHRRVKLRFSGVKLNVTLALKPNIGFEFK